eukprot:2290329-Rhodomonas_salina.1
MADRAAEAAAPPQVSPLLSPLPPHPSLPASYALYRSRGCSSVRTKQNSVLTYRLLLRTADAVPWTDALYAAMHVLFNA